MAALPDQGLLRYRSSTSAADQTSSEDTRYRIIGETVPLHQCIMALYVDWTRHLHPASRTAETATSAEQRHQTVAGGPPWLPQFRLRLLSGFQLSFLQTARDTQDRTKG